MSDPHAPRPDLNRILAQRLKALMWDQRLSTRRLALRAGVGEWTVLRILRGHDVRVTTLDKIATALQTDVAALLSRPAA